MDQEASPPRGAACGAWYESKSLLGKNGAKLIYVLNFPQFGNTYLEAALILASIELIVSMGRLTSAKADATNKLPTRNRNIF